MPTPSLVDATLHMTAPQYTAATTVLALSGTSNATSALATGTYRVIANVDCYFKQGTTGATATTSDVYLPADFVEHIYVEGTTNSIVAGIRRAVNGTLYLSPMKGG